MDAVKTLSVINLADHPRSLDDNSQLVWYERVPQGFNSVYQVTGGFVACLPQERCLEGLFDSVAQAQEALRLAKFHQLKEVEDRYQLAGWNVLEPGRQEEDHILRILRGAS